MKLLILFTLIAAAVVPLSAEQIGVIPEVGLYGGGQFGNNEANSGAAVMGNVALRLFPYMSLGVQGGWMPMTTKNNNISDADLSIKTLEVVPRLYAPLGRFQPYLAGGAARYFISETLRSTAPSNLTENVENKWGGVFGGGLDLAVNENMALGIDVAYLYLRSNVIRTFNGTGGSIVSSSSSVNLDSVRVLAGIRIKFVSPGWSNVY